MVTHLIKKNETPQDVSYEYTGSKTRVHELAEANPGRIRAMKTHDGRRAIDPVSWREGSRINLPSDWTGGVKTSSSTNDSAGTGAVGQVTPEDEFATGTGERLIEEAEDQAAAQGTGCPPGTISAVKPYRCLVVEGDWPDKVARDWLGNGPAYYGKRTLELLGANPQTKPKWSGTSCEATSFWPGMKLKIPANWPAPPQSFYDQGRIVKDDGTTYVPPSGGGPVEPDVPGGDGIDRVDWTTGGSSGDGLGIMGVLGIAAAGAAALFLGLTLTKKRGAK